MGSTRSSNNNSIAGFSNTRNFSRHHVLQGLDLRLGRVQETGQLGIKGQNIAAELKHLPHQLPHLLQPLVDVLRSQQMSDAISYHDGFLQHVHRSASMPAQQVDQPSETGPAGTQGNNSPSASASRFQAMQRLCSMDSCPPSESVSQNPDTGQSGDAGPSRLSPQGQSASGLTAAGGPSEGQSADADPGVHQALQDSNGHEPTGPQQAGDEDTAQIDWSAAMEVNADPCLEERAGAEDLQGDIDWDIDLAGIDVLEDEANASAEPNITGLPITFRSQPLFVPDFHNVHLCTRSD